ncbi:hypothetical protein AOC36_08225 [Erysipelothrix larvae]|uniref:HTH crp-type domain-containing protein n=1 Tax=Erysipelothrix larvae TaxID=1514105 RepID=A0A0X8H0S3_9FIRM|nr:hypothetical protein [Erysipelothrix larvae]AMC93972.1 hypothetical protein AOC36_08225 [Erysipelothrix larvae]
MKHLNGNCVSTDVSTLIEHWETIIEKRKTSSIWKLLYLIVGQPVINLKYLESKIGISLRASNILMKRAKEYGIL